jgi:serine/threonine-protein kinase
MAHIFLGQHEEDASPGGVVAVKFILPQFARDPDFVGMFREESRIVKMLSHPNLVRVLDVGESGGRDYLVMELLHGQSLWTLWDALRTSGVRMSPLMASHICARVAEGLHEAHELRNAEGKRLELVHRDVNPSNIFLGYDGVVKLIDFGLARASDRLHQTAPGVIKGKLAYVAPEQLLGSALDRRADIFGLAITLWELSVDRRLFKRDNEVDTVRAVAALKIPDPREIVEGYPDELWEILQRALSRSPASRFATAAEFGAALDAFIRRHRQPLEDANVAAMLHAFFAAERTRQESWMEEVIAARGASQRGPLRGASSFHAREAERPPPAIEVSIPRADLVFDGAVEDAYMPASVRIGPAVSMRGVSIPRERELNQRGHLPSLEEHHPAPPAEMAPPSSALPSELRRPRWHLPVLLTVIVLGIAAVFIAGR